MTRRTALSLVLVAGVVRAESSERASLRGTLALTADGHPTVTTAEGKTVLLDGDEGTRSVVNDERLLGTDFEALGHFTTADRFAIEPIYTRAMFVHKDGKRLFITYWCNVCYIRTYVPGNCRCCQKYTDLGLTENDAQ